MNQNHIIYFFLIAVKNTWIGLTKAQLNGYNKTAYVDGTYTTLASVYQDIRFIKNMNDNSACVGSASADPESPWLWSSRRCTDKLKVLCEYNCENINNSKRIFLLAIPV